MSKCLKHNFMRNGVKTAKKKAINLTLQLISLKILRRFPSSLAWEQLSLQIHNNIEIEKFRFLQIT